MEQSRMHEWIRGAESTGQCFQNTSNLCRSSLQRPKFSLCLACLASVLQALAKRQPFLSNSEFSCADPSEVEHQCCASNAPRAFDQACRLGLRFRAHNLRAR